LQELLDELDIIECFEQTGNKIRIGEITKNQEGLYRKFIASLALSRQPRYNCSGIQDT
jgi:hypothetical protein